MAESKVLEIAVKLKDLTKEALSSITNNIKNVGKDVKDLTKDTSSLNRTMSFKKSEREVKSLAGAFVKVKKEVKDLSASTKDKDLFGINQFHRLEEELNQMKEAYKKMKLSGKASIKELIIAQSKLNAKTNELKQSTSLWLGELNRVKTGAIGLVGVLYSLGKSFHSFSAFSQQMGEVGTLINLTSQQYSDLSNKILNLSTIIPQSTSELTSAEYDIISAGASLGSSLKVLELAGKAAIAGVTDTKTAVQIGMGVINAYGKSISDLSEVYDILFATVKKGITTFPELAQSIGFVLPIARNAGVDFRTVGAAIASMTKAGIPTSRAATALRGALMALSSPLPEAKKRFEALGITWKGLVPTLDAINKALSTGKLSKQGLRNLIPDVEARVGVLALTQNLKEFKSVLSGMGDVVGSTKEAFDIMKNTPANQVKLLTNELNKLKIQLGGVLAVGLLPVVRILDSFLKELEKSDVFTKALIGTLLTAGTAFALWRAGLSAIVSGLTSSIASIAATQAALGSLSAQYAKTSALMAGGLVISVVYTGYELGKLISDMWKLHVAMDEAEDATARMLAASRKLQARLSEFKNFKIPKNFLKLPEDKLKDLKDRLIKTRAYYRALMNELEERSKKRKFFGFGGLTEDAKAASRQLDDVKKKLKEIDAFFRTLAKDKADKLKKEAKTEEERGKAEEERRKADIEAIAAAEAIKLSIMEESTKKIELEKQRALEKARKKYAKASPEASAKLEAAIVAKYEKMKAAIKEKIARENYERRQRYNKLEIELQRRQTDSYLKKLHGQLEEGGITEEEFFAKKRERITSFYQKQLDTIRRQIKNNINPENAPQLELRLKLKKEEMNNALGEITEEQKQYQKDRVAMEHNADMEILRARMEILGPDQIEEAATTELEMIKLQNEQKLEEFKRLTNDKAKIQEMELLLQRQYGQKRVELEREVEAKRLAIYRQSSNLIGSTFENLYEATGKKVKAFFFLQKAAAIAEAIIQANLAATKVMGQTGIFGIPMSALIYANAMARVAMIASQTIRGFAEGGLIRGKKGKDQIIARLTDQEYVMRPEAVKTYGLQFMEAINRGLLKVNNLSLPDIGITTPRIPAYATGGMVSPSEGDIATGNQSSNPINIVNVIDPGLLDNYLSSSDGQNTILNVLSQRATAVRRILR